MEKWKALRDKLKKHCSRVLEYRMYLTENNEYMFLVRVLKKEAFTYELISVDHTVSDTKAMDLLRMVTYRDPVEVFYTLRQARNDYEYWLEYKNLEPYCPDKTISIVANWKPLR